MSTNMHPRLPRFNFRNSWLAYAIFDCDYSMKSVILSNRKYLFNGQFRHWMFFPHFLSAVLKFVLTIICSAIPAKIRQFIVPRIAVRMTAFHSFWSFPNKSLHYQFVWIYRCHLVELGQTNLRPVKPNIQVRFFNMSCSGVSYIAKIRNLIKTLKTNNIAPLLHGNHLMLNAGEV